MDFQSLGIAMSRTENFMVRPTVLVQILKVYEESHACSKVLEKIIEKDAALTAKVLRVAASSAYGVKGATNIARALSILGMDTVRSISVSLAYQEILNRKVVGCSFDRAIFGRHCLAVAIGSKGLAKILAPRQVDEVYVAGLLHDIGILPMEKFCSDDFGKAMKLALTQRKSLCEAEEIIFQYNHSQAGSLLANKWNLTPVVANAILYHHNPENEPTKAITTQIVAAANYLAYQCGFPAMPGISVHKQGETRLKDLELPEDTIREIEDMIVAEVELAEMTLSDKPKNSMAA